jgi:surface antigen
MYQAARLDAAAQFEASTKTLCATPSGSSSAWQAPDQLASVVRGVCTFERALIDSCR